MRNDNVIGSKIHRAIDEEALLRWRKIEEEPARLGRRGQWAGPAGAQTRGGGVALWQGLYIYIYRLCASCMRAMPPPLQPSFSKNIAALAAVRAYFHSPGCSSGISVTFYFEIVSDRIVPINGRSRGNRIALGWHWILDVACDLIIVTMIWLQNWVSSFCLSCWNALSIAMSSRKSWSYRTNSVVERWPSSFWHRAQYDLYSCGTLDIHQFSGIPITVTISYIHRLLR